jgi:hypothetical protein
MLDNDVVKEVNRVMANPEDSHGNPIALDFSKGSKTKGYSSNYSNNYDNIFQKNKKENNNNNQNEVKLEKTTIKP